MAAVPIPAITAVSVIKSNPITTVLLRTIIPSSPSPCSSLNYAASMFARRRLHCHTGACVCSMVSSSPTFSNISDETFSRNTTSTVYTILFTPTSPGPGPQTHWHRNMHNNGFQSLPGDRELYPRGIESISNRSTETNNRLVQDVDSSTHTTFIT